MLKTLPFIKPYLLPAAIVVTLLICYQLAFKQTYTAWQLNRHLQTQVSNASIDSQPAYLDRQNKSLSKVMTIFKAETSTYRNKVVYQVAQTAERYETKVTDVSINNAYSTKVYIIQKITVKGSFNNLLKTCFDLHRTTGIGYIRSVIFKKQPATVGKPDKQILMELYFEIAT